MGTEQRRRSANSDEAGPFPTNGVRSTGNWTNGRRAIAGMPCAGRSDWFSSQTTLLIGRERDVLAVIGGGRRGCFGSIRRLSQGYHIGKKIPDKMVVNKMLISY